MLIIVEGSDRSGKSALSRAVCDRLERLHPDHRVELLHAGPPKSHPLDEYERPLLDYRPRTGRHVVCDRWYLGERVYPDVFDRSTEMSYAVLAHVEAFLRSRGALLVLAHARPEVLRARLADEERGHPGRSLVTRRQLGRSHHLFDVEAANSSLPGHRVDTTANPSLGFVAEQVIEHASALEGTASVIAGLRTYVGPPSPRLLLVGDVRHAHRTADRDPEATARAAVDPSPVFMPYPATSGEYLLRAVDPLAVRGDYGIINANDVDDARQAWKILGEPVAVALGRRAWRTTGDWAFGAVPHPQYVRRFHNKHVTWYGRLIDRAAHDGGDLLRERPPNTWLDRE